MDVSQITNTATTASSSSTQVQGMGGHHRHHKSVSDQVSQMGSAIDNAVTAGTMTSAQAATLKSELADITQTLGQASTTATSAAASTSSTSAAASTASSTAAAGQSGSLSQLSDADRQKVFSELQDVRKQLFAVSNPQAASGSSAASGSNNSISNLFSQIDTNGDGEISQAEFTQFLAQVGANTLGYNQQGNASSALAGSLFSVTA